jgi:hypothetical protein
MQPAGQDPEARVVPGTITLPLCTRMNASPFWIMLLRFLGRLEHGMIPALVHKTARTDQRVLGTLLESAVSLCGAKHGMIFRYDGTESSPRSRIRDGRAPGGCEKSEPARRQCHGLLCLYDLAWAKAIGALARTGSQSLRKKKPGSPRGGLRTGEKSWNMNKQTLSVGEAAGNGVRPRSSESVASLPLSRPDASRHLSRVASWRIVSVSGAADGVVHLVQRVVDREKAIAIAVRNVSGRRRWSKLAEWLRPKSPVYDSSA